VVIRGRVSADDLHRLRRVARRDSISRCEREISLASTGSFASHGFTGTMTSTVSITLGRPVRSPGGSPPSLGLQRQVTVSYRATVGGTVTERFAAAASPATCTPLGACGQRGVQTIRLSDAKGSASLDAVGPASAPLSEFLVALGQRQGSAPQVEAFGTAAVHAAASSTAAIEQNGETCNDTVAVGGVIAVIERINNRILVRLSGTGANPNAGGRTNCPGPIVPTIRAFVDGSVPVGHLARRVVTIRVTRHSSFRAGGYRVELVPNLTLTLVRTRISVRTMKP
jgi:hypothetical protein